jgi:uncharacterized protein YecE (DUF72 family)
MAKWWIGCSGFHYKHWKGTFYPEGLAQIKWFNFYNQHFKTFELNVTFYRFPRVPVLENWYNKSDENFIFSVKAPKFITHYRQFKNTERMANDFYGIIRESLKEKLGPVLFQAPPQMEYSPEKLEQVVSSLDPSFKNVVEFRHESWWNAHVYNTLTKHNITFCGMSHPNLPEEVIQNTKMVYFRFHGVPHLYSSPYNVATLQSLANEIEGNTTVAEAFIYFNNDIGASAIKNAKQMDRYTGNFRHPS